MSRKELTVSDWFTEIDRCLDYRRRYGLEDSWAMLEALYCNVHDSQVNAGPNLIMSNGDTLVSNLSNPYPYISAIARSQEDVDNVSVVENVDNMLVCEMGMAEEMEAAILSGYLWSVGVLKIGYDSEFGFDSDFDLGTQSSPMGMTFTQFNKKQQRIEFKNVKPGMPWVSYVPPHDFLVPWGTRKVEDAEYCIHRIVRHIDDVKDDLKYNNTKNLQPSLSMEDYVRSYNSSMRPMRLTGQMSSLRTLRSGADQFRKEEYVELWEIHDKRTGKIKVIASGYDQFLRDDIDLLQIEGLPFVGFGFVPNARSFWRTSDAHYLLQAQLELTDITIQNAKLRRANVLKMLISEDAFDEEELNKLQSSRINLMVKVKSGIPLAEAATFINSPMNTMNDVETERIRRNARESIGQSRMDAGEFEPGGRKTKYEVQAVQQGGDTRGSRRTGVIAEAYCKVFRKINAILAKYWQTPKIMQVMDEVGAMQWKSITGSMLQGNYQYRTAFSNEGPVGRQVDRAMAMQLLPFFTQDPLADPAAVRRFLVRSMNDPSISAIYPREVLTGQINAPLQLPVQGVSGGGGGVSESEKPQTSPNQVSNPGMQR